MAKFNETLQVAFLHDLLQKSTRRSGITTTTPTTWPTCFALNKNPLKVASQQQFKQHQNC